MTLHIALTGRDVSLAVGVVFMARTWDFESSTARALLAGIRPDIWTPEFVGRRSALRIEIALSAEAIEAMRVTLHACNAELGDSDASWLDFRVAAPGNRRKWPVMV